MKDTKSTGETLTMYNHLQIDERMQFWSPLGLGAQNFTPQSYVTIILSYELIDSTPAEVRDMFDRVKATMSYGIYHYPIFTVAQDATYQMMEAALYHFCTSHGLSLKKPTFEKLIQYCKKNKLFNEEREGFWRAIQSLRNMTSHKRTTKTSGPNDALSSLQNAKEEIDALFVYGPPNYTALMSRRKERARQMRIMEHMQKKGLTELSCSNEDFT